jgi:aspartyl-tRNA(Asn)/glutamyl-tRNA(Gln) amidotransferase subunit C
MTSPKLSHDEVQHIARIYRLGMSPEDVETLRHQLSDILENIQVLNQVETTDVPPKGHSVTLVNVMRDDEVLSPLSSKDALANAPLREEDHFRVKAVLD